MKFLAIDSSLAHTGVAVGKIINDSLYIEGIYLCETEKTKNKQVRASSDTIERCRQTHKFVHDLIKTHKPDVIFVETPSGSQSAAGMKSYGTTCQLIAGLYPESIEVTPQETKVASVNDKTASKRAIIDWAYDKYPLLSWIYDGKKLQNKNEHMADAIAIAHAAVKTVQFGRIVNFIKQHEQ
jgi:Holliday junction resolvasome RuvABC endonuclease subunit